MEQQKALVGIIMGSNSDAEIMRKAADLLSEFGIPFELEVVSAHRTPDRMIEYAKTALSRGLKVVIAGAGGAAHLPGMVASMTILPVIGVPIQSRNSVLGLDSIFSILQMPSGIPVATVALNGSANAALLAIRILANDSEEIQKKLTDHMRSLHQIVLEQAKEIHSFVYPNQVQSPFAGRNEL
jgi:5-(carboxyamino)imidazole ribonucleotide mutase